jgi:hypothetical protein
MHVNREMGSFVERNRNLYGGQLGYGVVPGPLSGTTTATDALILIYNSAMADSVPAKTPMKSDSGLTYPVLLSRKRPREAAINNHPLLSFPPNVQNRQSKNRCGSFTFIGEDISLQIQQQQLEIDRFITEHVRLMLTCTDAQWNLITEIQWFLSLMNAWWRDGIVVVRQAEKVRMEIEREKKEAFQKDNCCSGGKHREETASKRRKNWEDWEIELGAGRKLLRNTKKNVIEKTRMEERKKRVAGEWKGGCRSWQELKN